MVCSISDSSPISNEVSINDTHHEVCGIAVLRNALVYTFHILYKASSRSGIECSTCLEQLDLNKFEHIE